MRALVVCSLAVLAACGAVSAATAAVGPNAAPRSAGADPGDIHLRGVHLGLTPGGWIGVHAAYAAPGRTIITASVAVGTRPRTVFGFYRGGRGLSSPLRDRFPNDSELVAGRRYRVKVSLCERATALGSRAGGGGPVARAAKGERCGRRTTLVTYARVRARFRPPS